jgi:FMN phosphatase YigB (HAD superfamily)
MRIVRSKKKIIIFDIDNTLCKTKELNYKKSKPLKSRIKTLNKLYDNGHIIKIFTARYMGKHNGDIPLIKKKYYKKTIDQLKKWGVKFHELIMGKPVFDIFIDDKSYNTKDQILKKIFKKIT